MRTFNNATVFILDDSGSSVNLWPEYVVALKNMAGSLNSTGIMFVVNAMGNLLTFSEFPCSPTIAIIDDLKWEGGGTQIGDGLKTAYKLFRTDPFHAKRKNIVVVSDGEFMIDEKIIDKDIPINCVHTMFHPTQHMESMKALARYSNGTYKSAIVSQKASGLACHIVGAAFARFDIDVTTPVAVSMPKNESKKEARTLCHSECNDGFCHRRYENSIILKTKEDYNG